MMHITWSIAIIVLVRCKRRRQRQISLQTQNFWFMHLPLKKQPSYPLSHMNHVIFYHDTRSLLLVRLKKPSNYNFLFTTWKVILLRFHLAQFSALYLTNISTRRFHHLSIWFLILLALSLVIRIFQFRAISGRLVDIPASCGDMFYWWISSSSCHRWNEASDREFRFRSTVDTTAKIFGWLHWHNQRIKTERSLDAPVCTRDRARDILWLLESHLCQASCGKR